MGKLRAVVRGIKLAGYFMQAAGELIVDDPETRQRRAEWLHLFCWRAMKGMGIMTVRVVGEFPKYGAVISNHLSYLDIVVLASLRPCVFVSKSEIAEMPVLGWMTTRSGTVYVERGRGTSALKASQAMKAAMDDGLPVVFFPEGTTSDGRKLLKFHSGLIGLVLAADVPVTPVFLRYSLAGRQDPGVTVTEDVCWGDKPLWEHVFGFLGLRGVHAEVRFAEEPIRFSRPGLHRKAAALEAQNALASLGGDIPVERDGPGACEVALPGR